MAALVVKLQFLDTVRGRCLFITINGRQALHEAPRLVGRCVYCKGPCTGATPDCAWRVFEERRAAPPSRR